MKQSNKDRYGYPLWIPLLYVSLIFCVPGGIIAAFATENLEWLGLSALSALAIWISTRA